MFGEQNLNFGDESLAMQNDIVSVIYWMTLISQIRLQLSWKFQLRSLLDNL